MRVIALEEHYTTQGFLDGPGRGFLQGVTTAGDRRFPGGGQRLLERLSDLADGRIAEMDTAGVDVQVLSLTSPGLEQMPSADAVALATDVNDELAAAIGRNPTRFAGFAAVPTADPPAAADELERVVRAHGFVGAIINGHCQGRRLDDEFFWPILERAEGLGVPIYLHPTPPPKPVTDALYAGAYPAEVSFLLSMAAWGWHIETATHILRLIVSGALDRFPNLQLIIGHMGEVLPCMVPRLDQTLPTTVTGLQRAPSEYLRANLHYTFSGFNWTSAFLELLFQVGVDRMMFSTDYPYQSMTDGTAFLAGIPVTPTDRERIAHSNAEALLGL
jgi:uncharacterized protein